MPLPILAKRPIPLLILIVIIATIVVAVSGAEFTVEWSAYSKPSATPDVMLVFVGVNFHFSTPSEDIAERIEFKPLINDPSAKYKCGTEELEINALDTLNFSLGADYTPPPFASYALCTFTFSSTLRVPISFKLTTKNSKMGSVYNFPGISPITRKIEPMIQIRDVSPGDNAPPSRIIGHSIDFPQSLYDAAFFFYVPVTSSPPVTRRTNPNDNLAISTSMSLHFWTSDFPYLLDHEAFPETNSIYPYFNLENETIKISRIVDDITTITPLLSDGLGDYSMTVKYDLKSATRLITDNIATTVSDALSQSVIEISFPETKIYNYVTKRSCTYSSRDEDGTEHSEFLAENNTLDNRSTGLILETFQCVFTIDSPLDTLHADAVIFGGNIASDSNQFAVLLQLTPFDLNKDPSLVVFGNRYTQEDWKALLNGNLPTNRSDQISPPGYQVDPRPPSAFIFPPGITIAKQVALGSTIALGDGNTPYLEYEWRHVFGDRIHSLGKREIIYTASSFDRWGTCRAIDEYMDNAFLYSQRVTDPLRPNVKIIQFDQELFTEITFICPLYRFLSQSSTFLDSSATYASTHLPIVQIKTENQPTQESEGNIFYPLFIPTPKPLIRHTDTPLNEINLLNVGLGVLNWNDIDTKLFSSVNLNLDLLTFEDLLNPEFQYLYKNVIDPSTFTGIFDFRVGDASGCGIHPTMASTTGQTLDFDFPLKPSLLPIVNDGMKKCTLLFRISIPSYSSKGLAFTQSFPLWKSQSDRTKPFFGITVNGNPKVIELPLSTHPLNPNPPTLFITPLSSLRIHICYPQIITTPSPLTLSFRSFRTSAFSTPAQPEDSQVVFQPISPNTRDSFYHYCLNGFPFYISRGNAVFDNSLGDFAHFGINFLVGSSPSDLAPTPIYSPKFLIQSPMGTILSTVKIQTSEQLIPYQPSSGPEVQIIKPDANTIDVSFNFGADASGVVFNNLLFSLQIPTWLNVDISNPSIHRCSTPNQPIDPRLSSISLSSRTVSTGNPDITTVVFSVSSSLFPLHQGPATTTCTIGINYDTATSPIPVNPSLSIPVTPITVTFQDRLTVPNGVHSSTLTPSNNNMVFLYHKTPKLFCPTDTNLYAPCIYQDQPVTTPPPSTTTPPPIITKLPVTTRGLSGLCDIVLTNRDIVEIYDDTKHKNMCSIPIAGMVTSRTISRTELNDSLSPGALALLPPGQVDFTLCDCQCKGYWHDDVMNLDQKKCSKCSVPECPNLFTPNNECTACECITEQCKRFRTYIFSTVYLTPQVLRHVVESEGETDQILYKSDQLSDIELSKYLSSPDQSTKSLYFSIMSSFSQYLTDYIKTRAIDDLFTTSTLESITMTPLVEGSFTVWKLTFSIINNSQQPISSLAPLYGLPTLQSTIGQLFSSFHNNEHLNLDPTNDPPQSQLGLAITTPILSTEYSSSLKLFTSDAIRTGCLSREDAIKLKTTNAPATADMLHQCPLPNQYTPIHNDLAKTDSFNPLWSACSTSSSPSMEFTQYESLLQPTVSTISLSIRQIFPRCLDFAGVDVGMLHVPCQIDSKSIVYSTTSSALLLPIYTQTLLSSFSTDTLDLPIQQRISQLRQTIFPKFPSFPQLTIVTCPIVEVLPPGTKPKKPKKNSIPESDRCPVGTYGDKCQLENTVEQTSMFMSPTNLSTQSHSHIQWEYKGDNTQELTLVLQSNTKTNTGSGYFAWSQLLGTVPVASLYASAQIPTIDQSKLFQHVYDSIADGNTDMTDIYDQSTQVIIRGYFTRAANITISLDPDQITQNFTFELPMLCTDFNVQCRDSVSQFCHQSDGRCRCKPGYYNPNPDQQRRSDYVVESVGTTLRNFDGDDLSCLPICQNDGDWVTATQSCTCQPGSSGANCEVSDQCQQSQKDLCAFGSNTISSDPISLGPQVANGYVKFAESKCQDSCTCYGKWSESITPSPSDSRSCSTCSLKPISRELYHADSLDMIEKAYLDSAELAPHYSPDRDEKYTQIYQPTVDSVTTPHDLTRQRCYITGTQNKTWEYGQCSQCLCHRGYGGDYCQLHIAYANITYTPGENNKYHYDGMTEILLFDKIVEELSLSMNNFNRDDLFIVQHNTNSHWIEVGFYTGLDFFIRNAELASAANVHQEFEQEKSQLTTEEPSSFSILSQYLSPLSSTFQFQPLANVNTWNQPPITFNSQLPSNLDNLYTQWGQLQGNLPTAPIVHQDSGSFLGEITLPEPIQDPVCFDQGLLGCSGDPPKRASSTALIIGLVVGLLCAALLFLILVLVLRWCKKNERGFWKSHEQQDRDEMSNFVPTTRKGFTGSTAAPSMTVGTLSIMPMPAGAGVEMSNTGGASATSPKSSVQSVNSHTEIKDPTLPPEYKAYKDLKGNVFYINSETMTTSWTHPNEKPNNTVTGGGGGGGDDYRSDW